MRAINFIRNRIIKLTNFNFLKIWNLIFILLIFFIQFLIKKHICGYINTININLNSIEVFTFPTSNIQIHPIPFHLTNILRMLIIPTWTVSLIFLSSVTNYIQSSSKTQQIPFIWYRVPIPSLHGTLINDIINKIKQTRF